MESIGRERRCDGHGNVGDFQLVNFAPAIDFSMRTLKVYTLIEDTILTKYILIGTRQSKAIY